ncbi:MAG: pitrilysin family protein [Candidatus Omnitrophota bacterium]|nr:pitrilysin family protein [Candidatus Omnitrophota bacterium]
MRFANMYDITNINGATFIFSPFKDLETASLGIFVRIGSRYEKKNLRGISHFLEHMVFKGSKKYSHKQIKQEIEGRGGTLNAYTSEEFTGYYAHFLNKNLEPTLDILTNMVSEPLLREKEIEKERKVILEEIKMYNDLPSSRAETLLSKLIWSNHSLGEEIIGDFSTVKRIQRKELADFSNTYYQPSNTVVAFSGNYDQNKIIRLLQERIGKVSSRVSLNVIPPQPLRGIHVKVEGKKLEQCYLCIGFRGISYTDSQRAVIELINVLLGANMSSRLFEEIREKKGLCYDISSAVAKYKDGGVFTVRLGLDKSKIGTALITILKELKKIKEVCVPYKELTRAKDYLLGQTAMGLEQPQGRMFYLAQFYLTLGKIYSFDEIKKEVEEVTPDNIKHLSNEIFDFRNMCISSVGDFSDKTEVGIRETLKKGGYHS